MKKAMWLVSLASLALTAVALQFLPDRVPMHYNAAGEIDRWGSKFENLIFPAILMAMALFWHLLIGYYEKKAANGADEKIRGEAASNTTALKVVGLSTAVMFTLLQAVFLYSAYAAAKTVATHAVVDVGKVSCILMGLLLVIFGVLMPGTKKNPVIGVRISWSMYNAATWEKSNRFGGAAFAVEGILAVLTALFVPTGVDMMLLLVYLLVGTAVTLIYCRKVYLLEKAKEGQK